MARLRDHRMEQDLTFLKDRQTFLFDQTRMEEGIFGVSVLAAIVPTPSRTATQHHQFSQEHFYENYKIITFR